MSLLTRKGKRWPDKSKDPPRYTRPSSNSFQNYQKPSQNPLSRYPNLAADSFSITGIDMNGEQRADSLSFTDSNEIVKYKISPPSTMEQTRNGLRHHRRKNERRHVLQDQVPRLEITTNTPTVIKDDTENQEHDSITEKSPVKHNNFDNDSDHEEENVTENPGDNEKDAQKPKILSNDLPRRCKGQDNEGISNCTIGYHFPSSVLMIEAHYNQTVRDFLQICTPVERVEIDGLDDLHVLLSALYQQMPVNDMNETPSSIVLLFNLEHYANWTKERVIDVLQATVSAFDNDFDDMMIYSKFHQDGADSNGTHLSLTYDVKYWLSNLCNERLTHCADFASIILESVLQMNEMENENQNHSKQMLSSTDSLDDASTKANA